MEDYFYKFLSLYNNLPISIKRILGKLYNLLPRSFRYGNFYKLYTKRLHSFNSAKNIQKINSEQNKILFSQVNRAINSVRYYQKYPECLSTETFQKYPIIDKKIITTNFSDFLNPYYTNKRLKTNTGGSSGNPMELYLEQNVSRSKEKAHFDWYWGQYGYKPNDKILMIRGMPLKDNRNFEYNTIDNLLTVSCYNINEKNISYILSKINQFKPKFIHAYPSSLKIITKLLEPYLERIEFKIQAIFLGSEHLLENDRFYFNNFYQSQAVNWYGHSERLIHGGNCPFSNDFHFYPAYGYIELLDEKNMPINELNKIGKIVATGFDNNAMPFIRYDTGDLGELSSNVKCQCGFTGLSLRKIYGRGQEYILLSDATRVSVTAFIFGQHLEAFKNIIEMQVVQKEIGKIEINIIKSSTFTLDDENSLIDTLLNSVDYKLCIVLKEVKLIPKTHRGKNIFFISHIKN